MAVLGGLWREGNPKAAWASWGMWYPFVLLLLLFGYVLVAGIHALWWPLSVWVFCMFVAQPTNEAAIEDRSQAALFRLTFAALTVGLIVALVSWNVPLLVACVSGHSVLAR